MLTPEKIAQALACGQPRCSCGKRSGDGFLSHCPAHQDNRPSLAISERDGKILVKCFAGCPQEAVISALKQRGLWPVAESARGYKGNNTSGEGRNRATAEEKRNKNRGQGGCQPDAKGGNRGATAQSGITLAELAQAKGIPVENLQAWGVAETKLRGVPALRIPYMNQEGEVVGVRFRHSLTGAQRFSWRKGDRVTLYGQWLMAEFRKKGWCLLVEGETDCWTAWLHGLPALGIPGKSTWRSEWGEWLNNLHVYLWQEPDAAELPDKVAGHIPHLMVIPAPSDFKDLNDAHVKGQEVQNFIENLKSKAIPAATLIKEQKDEQVKVLKEKAGAVLCAPDPLEMVKAQIRSLGYGGSLTPTLIIYLAATSRLLAMRPGAMPVHLLLTSQASAGKSYTLQTILRLLPPEAYHQIAAGSPRALIYDEAQLVHKVLVFGEADSLPAGEDNPAASAIRNLLQDHHLHYEVTVRDPETGKHVVDRISKPGPTVLVSTSTKRLGHQLDTRVFSLEINDGAEHIREALNTQAELELAEALGPDGGLIAYQGYLQLLAPWEVRVPFVRELAREIGKQATVPRILRDFARLLSLIKAVAVIRHKHRSKDGRGRVLASLEDYRLVYELVGQMYETTITGASQSIRDVVQAVEKLGMEEATVVDVAKRLGINKSTAWRRVKAAIKHGWLINTETRRGFPASLKLGDPLPEVAGLPDPERLRGFNYGTGEATETATDQHPGKTDDSVGGCAVAPETDDDDPLVLKAGLI
uniref:DUF3631 domain-containing protein n=1 Tax=Desulfobacca acetoxidans TaxID=60893 RepID=A0A7C3SJ23_9BACT